ncbi:MAG: amidohydrolase [Propionibacteriales bacterium]|nr:amidohydrolase [Propionibacteriales bacterium]
MEYADLVFIGGPVFTADTVRSRTDAVAVSGGRIIAVGSADVTDLIGPSTEVVDLAGRLLIPGFQDAHIHPVGGGMELLRCNLADAHDVAAYQQVIATYAAAQPDEEWILGGGWAMAAFPGGTPTAAILDALVPDRPVFLPNRDHHSAWVNSVALAAAGIDRNTPDPADGRIERDADGNPSGVLHEGAMSLVERLIPEPTTEQIVEGLLAGQAYLHSLGITGWQDAIIGVYSGIPDAGEAYLQVARDGRLTARVVGALWWDRTAGAEQIPSLVARRERLQAGRFRATSIKIMQDGVPENFTAAMTFPYEDGCGCATDRTGISFVPVEVLNQIVPELDALGFQLHFHGIGDRAVRECLDAIELAVASNGRNDQRHHIAHLQVVHPDDVARLAQLGVVANLQPLWATLDEQMAELNLPFLGQPRGSWQYPFGDLLRSGTVLAGGSDWPVTTPNPFHAMHTAVTRQSAPGYSDQVAEPFLENQKLDLATIMVAYTAGSAFVNHCDHEVGTIEVGKLADLVVLDSDPFATGDIANTGVLQTFVEGVRVYAADGA